MTPDAIVSCHRIMTYRRNMKKLLAVFLLMLPLSARAQSTSPTDVQKFMAWLGQQQARVGVGYLAQGDRAKWVATEWNLIQVGQSGLNIAQPSTAHDYVDLSPIWATANQRSPRYGTCLAVHGGNIWNDSHLPASIESHINKTPLPPFVVSYCPLWPSENGVNFPIEKFRPWGRDGMVTISYGFGGS